MYGAKKLGLLFLLCVKKLKHLEFGSQKEAVCGVNTKCLTCSTNDQSQYVGDVIFGSILIFS